jgi:cytochrome d ubiquinol oxidase subunit I
MLAGGLGTVVTGDMQAKIMTEQQPMKMAAAEAIYDTEQPASFSVFTIGTLDGSEEVFSIKIPRLLSYLATSDWDAEVEGINNLRQRYLEEYGEDPGATYYDAGDYTPVIPVTYWSFRLMIGLGAVAMLVGAALLWLTRKDRVVTHRRWAWAAIAVPLMPLAANSFGWIFTEMGRQPWVVFGVMTTANGVSPGVSAGEVATSLLAFTVVYAVLAIVEVGLIVKYVRAGADPFEEPPDVKLGGDESDKPLAFAY